jgi:hypothetical protein
MADFVQYSNKPLLDGSTPDVQKLFDNAVEWAGARQIATLEWPSVKPVVSYHDFAYQAQSRNVPLRVVAKVEWHQGELFPRVGWGMRLWLIILAYNLGNFVHRLDLPEGIEHWSLTSIQTKLIKIAGRLVRYANTVSGAIWRPQFARSSLPELGVKSRLTALEAAAMVQPITFAPSIRLPAV